MKRLDVMETGREEGMREVQEETLREQAGLLLEGIIAAAENAAEETKEITLSRNGRAYFKLLLRPVSEAAAKNLRKSCTKYTKNKAYGVKVPEETDMTKYRSMLIYEATVNKEDTWDNKALWKALDFRYPVVQGWQTVDQVLLAGEKDKIVEEINELSGYSDEEEEELEEAIKN